MFAVHVSKLFRGRARAGLLSIFIGAILLVSCADNSADASGAIRAKAGGIPLLYVQPKGISSDGSAEARPKLVVWQNGFTGNKEGVLPELRDLAAKGFLALSFDNYQHGERALAKDNLWRRVFTDNQFRKGMWPIIGHSVEDASQVIDWAIANLNVDTDSICMGGYSMGGDIAVAVAGVDKRVSCVAAIVSTPDWARPQMERLDKPGERVKQGRADSDAQRFFDRYNPISHIDSYSHRPAISFESGRNDFHIPASDAQRFVAKLKQQFPEIHARVVLHDAGHQLAPSMWDGALDWFDRHLAP